jgi:hypothetical protein
MPRPYRHILPRRAAYCRYGKRIVFSRLYNDQTIPLVSAINDAETIILDVSEALKINPRESEFFDLQTYQGYDDHELGEYTFNRLALKWESDRISHISWQKGFCCDALPHDFRGEFCGSENVEPRNKLFRTHPHLKEPDDWYTYGYVLNLTWAVIELWRDKKPELFEQYLQAMVDVCEIIVGDNKAEFTMENFNSLNVPATLVLSKTAGETLEMVMRWLINKEPEFEDYIDFVSFLPLEGHVAKV